MSDNPNLPAKPEPERSEGGTETKREQVKRQLIRLRGEFSGPLPPPGILEGYEKICPGASERIIKMAEDAASHHRTIGNKVVEASISEGIRAQWMAFAIVVAFLIAGVVLGVNGHPVSGTILGSAGVGTIVIAFLKHRAGMSHETSEIAENDE